MRYFGIGTLLEVYVKLYLSGVLFSKGVSLSGTEVSSSNLPRIDRGEM